MASAKTAGYRQAMEPEFHGASFHMRKIRSPWGDDGPTDLDYGVPLCRHHHDLIHLCDWTVAYDPNRRAAIFTSPDDQVVIGHTPTALPWAA